MRVTAALAAVIALALAGCANTAAGSHPAKTAQATAFRGS
jgi:hypothetical protein